MVPDKPQKVENFHFTWCGYIGFRTRCYVKYMESFLSRVMWKTFPWASWCHVTYLNVSISRNFKNSWKIIWILAPKLAHMFARSAGAFEFKIIIFNKSEKVPSKRCVTTFIKWKNCNCRTFKHVYSVSNMISSKISRKLTQEKLPSCKCHRD